jgi:hypothetical protein
VSITKVVALFTTNPTKFCLQFSEFFTIFYAFYKFQPKVKHYLRSIFHRGPWKLFRLTPRPLVRVKLPGKSWPLAIGSLGMVAGGAGPNSGAPAPDLARESGERG